MCSSPPAAHRPSTLPFAWRTSISRGPPAKPSKKLILARENGYHGSTYLAASITGIERNWAGFHHLASGAAPLVHHLSCPNVYRAPGGMSQGAYRDMLIAELEAAIDKLGADNIACFRRRTDHGRRRSVAGARRLPRPSPGGLPAKTTFCTSATRSSPRSDASAGCSPRSGSSASCRT